MDNLVNKECKIRAYVRIRNIFKGVVATQSAEDIVNNMVFIYVHVSAFNGKKIITLNEVRTTFNLDMNMADRTHQLASFIVELLGSEVCKNPSQPEYGVVAQIHFNAELIFSNELVLETDFIDFNRLCKSFVKRGERDNSKQYIRYFVIR